MEALSTLIPYRTEHINRFGNYVINPNKMAEPLEQHPSRGALPFAKSSSIPSRISSTIIVASRSVYSSASR